MVVLNDGWSTGPYRRPCKELWCPGPEAQQRASPPDKDHAGDQEKREQMQINSCDTNSDKNTGLVLHGSWLKATFYLMMELYLLLASPCQLWRKGELSTSKQLWFLILRHHNLQSLLFDLLVGLLVDLPVDLLVGLPLLVPPPRWGASCRLWHQSTLCRSDKRTRFANPQIQRAHSNRANWKTNHYSKLLLWISWWGKYAKKLNMPINVGHMHFGLGNACRDYWFAHLTLQLDQKSYHQQ